MRPIDEKFTTELRAQVDHLSWLLDNMTFFGARPVVKASKELLGTGIVAMGTNPSLSKRIGKAVAAMFVVLAVMKTGVSDVNGILEGVADMKDSVVEILSPQKQIEGPRGPAQIEAPPHALNGDGNGEVFDAEIVEDTGAHG